MRASPCEYSFAWDRYPSLLFMPTRSVKEVDPVVRRAHPRMCSRLMEDSPQREGINDSGYQEQGVGPGVEPDRKTVRQGLDHEARRTGYRGGYSRDSDRLARARPGSRSGRAAAWARGRNLRPRIVRQDHARTRMYRG